MLNGKSVLITGGTGQIGRELISHILDEYPKVNKISIYSRDEKKQVELSRLFPLADGAPVRYFIGDVREKERLHWAMSEMDVVFHLASMNNVETVDYNPFEAIKTNILGTQNLIEACLDSRVTDVISVSMGDAVHPKNLFESSKNLAEKLIVSANNIVGTRSLKYSAVRLPSLFSAQNLELSQLKNRASKKKPIELPINADRFFLPPKSAARFITRSLEQHWGGEVFIPKCSAFMLKDFVHCFSTEAEIAELDTSDSRAHESMATASEFFQTRELDKCFAVLPTHPNWDFSKWDEQYQGKKLKDQSGVVSSDFEPVPLEKLKEWAVKAF